MEKEREGTQEDLVEAVNLLKKLPPEKIKIILAAMKIANAVSDNE